MTLFTKIINREIKGTIVHEDQHCAAFLDVQPQAPEHILIVPKAEIPALSGAALSDQALLGHLLLTAANVARDRGFSAEGYRVVINVGKNGGQSVDHLHLHLHLLGGRALDWPPG